MPDHRAQRLAIPFALAVCLAAPKIAVANSFSFGPAILVSTANVRHVGAPGTHSISESHSSSGDTANFRAQASVDAPHGGSPFSSWERTTYTWDVPYTITREIGTLAGDPELLLVPLQRVEFSITFSGAGEVTHLTGIGNNGYEASRIENLTVQSLGGRFLSPEIPDLRAFRDLPVAVNWGPETRNFELGADADGPSAGEVGSTGEIPTDYRLWEDAAAPLAAGYDGTSRFLQSFTDVLRVSFRIEAVSSPRDFSIDAGPAIACAGLPSDIEGFPLVPNCGDGLTIRGSVTQIGTQQVPIPETTTGVLVGVALLGLALHRRT